MKTLSDEQIKAYFLGKLSEPEAESFEIEYASSAELTEQAQAVERELIDDYLRENLPAPDKSLFETNFLTTDARRKKLQFAAHLWKIASESAVPKPVPVEPASPSPFWKAFFGTRRRFGLAFGGLFLLLILGAAAFYLQTLNVDKLEVAEVKDTNQTPKLENPPVEIPDDQTVQTPAAENPTTAATDRSVQNKQPERDLNAPPKNLPGTKTVLIPKTVETGKTALSMIVKLFPGSVRGDEEQAIKLAPNVRNLVLLLSPAGEPNNYRIYRAVVKTPEDETVFTAPSLKALSFTIPAEKLESRTYIISLEGRNSKDVFESIADYTVRVRR